MSNLVPRTNGEMVPLSPGEKIVAGFFDMDAFGRICEEKGWSLESELETIFDLIDSPDEKTKMSALKHLYKVRQDIARRNGLIGSKTMAIAQDSAGNTLTVVQEGNDNMIQQLREANARDDSFRTVDATVTIHEPRSSGVDAIGSGAESGPEETTG